MAAEVGESYEQKEPMERVKSLEKPRQDMQRDQKACEEWSSKPLLSREKQLSSTSPSSSSPAPAGRCPGFAYSSSFKKPSVPSAFHMPLHYPKYTKADYDSMPEWKLDRLLEEYGLPVLGSLRDKRQYAIGIFLWSKPPDQ